MVCGHQVHRQRSLPICTCTSASRTCLVYDADLSTTFHFQIGRLWSNIEWYKAMIGSSLSHGSNDIPFNSVYQNILRRVGQNGSFVSLLLHIDGISLCKSTKHTLWLLSGIIIELPPHLRYRRENMVLLSIYVGQSEPVPKLWLQSCFSNLKRLKSEGKTSK